ncbi:MAG: ABC transporter ATP-binding protein [Novosphingobium sp.]|nr:ABC transporter ATP-binding protein [Novosphingobium sp.]
MAHIRIQGISLEYPIYDVTSRSLKISLLQQAVGSRLAKDRRNVRVQAIQNLTMNLSDGDRVGLVGHNGSGKSTLLRVIAGVTFPQLGKMDIKGRVVPLIERGLGVNSELTGRQNISLPLMLLGATGAEIRAAHQEIPEWTGLGEFIDLPVRTYSDGMRARLMFAISTAIHGDILLLDEWLGAGDAQFVQAASERMERMLASAGIMVVASHSAEIIQKFCTKAVWMERGEIIAIGSPDMVMQRYLEGLRPPQEEIEEMMRAESNIVKFKTATSR